MGRGAWRVQDGGGGLVETACLATAATLDAIGARRVDSRARLDGGKAVFTYDVRDVRDLLASSGADLVGAAAPDGSPLDIVRGALADTFLGRFTTAYYTLQRHARRMAREGGES